MSERTSFREREIEKLRASFREIERECKSEIEHQRATVTTVTGKESDRERDIQRERGGGGA